MKRWLSLLTLAACAGAAGWFALGRTSAAQPPAAPAHGPNARFYAVQQKLDPGGSFYLYSDLKGALQSCMDRIRPILQQPGYPPEVMHGFTIVDKVMNRLGLYGIHDLGVSVIPDGELNRTKLYISAPEGRRNGLLASLGGAPHPFAILDRAPAQTRILLSGDCDTQALYRLMLQVGQDIAGPDWEVGVERIMEQMKAQTGIDLRAVNASLGGEFAFLVDQDPAVQATIPIEKEKVRLDAPRLALVIKVKDATLYDALKRLAQMKGLPPTAESTDGKLKLFPLPSIPNPFWLCAPAFAFDGDQVYVSSHIDLIKRLATPSGDLLKDTAEFKRLQAGLPTEGNGLSFISPRLGATLVELGGKIQAAQQRQGEAKPQAFIALDSLKGNAVLNGGAITIRVNEPNGVQVVSRSHAGSAHFIGAAVVAPAAILAAVAVPNFMEAQSRSKVARVKSDLRTMSIAIECYKLDQSVYPAWSAEPELKAHGRFTPANQPTFRIRRDANDKLVTLTTPVSYITGYFDDPFSPSKKASLSYWTPEKGQGYILWSAGPDGCYDMNLGNIGQLYGPQWQGPTPLLTSLTYDPSNGTTSRGDIWRVQQ